MRNKSKLSNNKKGEDMLVDFWTILVFVILLIILFIIFMLTKTDSENRIAEDFKNKDAAFMLNSFMMASTPNTNEKIATIVTRDTINDDFTDTKNYFRQFFAGIENYNGKVIDDISLCIYDGSLKGSFSLVKSEYYAIVTGHNLCIDSSAESEILLPKPDGSVIKVKLAIQTLNSPGKYK